MTDTDQVVLVNHRDQPLGELDKLAAHRQGRLHRAFSVILRNSQGELLLQRRAMAKYHSGGLWSNTCCSHPRPGEAVVAAGRRRLHEEMGLDTELDARFSLIYRAEFANGLVEHEYDHVLLGQLDDDPHPDPAEAMDWRWLNPARVQSWVDHRPWEFSVWFPLLLEHLLAEHRGYLGDFSLRESPPPEGR